MSKYTKIIVVDAIIWNKLGDHPMVVEPIFYFSSPSDLCPICRQKLLEHGTLNGQRVCPGNYIVDDVDGSTISLTPEQFAKRYEST